MDELLKQLAEVEAQHRAEDEARVLKLYVRKTQILLQSLKHGLITLDQVRVTPDGWATDTPDVVLMPMPLLPTPEPEPAALSAPSVTSD